MIIQVSRTEAQKTWQYRKSMINWNISSYWSWKVIAEHSNMRKSAALLRQIWFSRFEVNTHKCTNDDLHVRSLPKSRNHWPTKRTRLNSDSELRYNREVNGENIMHTSHYNGKVNCAKSNSPFWLIKLFQQCFRHEQAEQIQFKKEAVEHPVVSNLNLI